MRGHKNPVNDGLLSFGVEHRTLEDASVTVVAAIHAGVVTVSLIEAGTVGQVYLENKAFIQRVERYAQARMI